MYKKAAKKKVFCRPVAIDWGRGTSSLPNLSKGEIEGRDQTEPWFRGLTSEVPTFSFWFISFLSVITCVQFAHVVLSIFSSARPLTVYKYFFFLSRVQIKEKSAQNQTMRMFEEKKKAKQTKLDKCFHFKKKKKEKCNTWRHRMKFFFKCATFRTLGLNSVVVILFNILHSVSTFIFMDYLKPCVLC